MGPRKGAEEAGSNREEKHAFLSTKTAFLIAITTFWRPASDLARISYKSIQFTSNAVEFMAHDVKEHGSKSARIVAFSKNPKVCPVQALKVYLNTTHDAPARKDSEKLFIATNGLHAVTDETISTWITTLIPELGIDASSYTSHSTRATSASTALIEGLPLHAILSRANWGTAATQKILQTRLC